MEENEFNSRMRAEVEGFRKAYRKDDAAFLIWFLKNIFCLEEEDAVECVCDGPNDKGIDGIWIDEDSEEIYVFQSEFSVQNDGVRGDNKIRTFAGVKEWFSSEDSVSQLLKSLANKELKNLIIQFEVMVKVARGFELRLVFVTNKTFDENAKEFLRVTDFIEPYDRNELFRRFTYIAEVDVENTPKVLDLPSDNAIEYETEAGNKTIVLRIPVLEILKLDGIRDRSLFSRDVRYWVGRTRVNKEIRKTLIRSEEHQNFFLYHNGIAIVCSRYDFDPNQRTIRLEDYQVVNGCQSILSFYENELALSADICVLTKIIEVEQHNPLIKNVTYYANNQNAISIKDLRATDRVQIGIKRQFSNVFDNRVLYKTRRGERERDYEEVIETDLAAQLIVSFYFGEPYNSHLKTKLLGDRYEQIFSRKITPGKLYLPFLVHKIIQENNGLLELEQVRNYGLAKFAVLRFMGDVLRDDELGKDLCDEPDKFFQDGNLPVLKEALTQLFKYVVIEVNASINEYINELEDGSFFDYKNLFKNKPFVDKIGSEVLRGQKRALLRNQGDAFSEIYRRSQNKHEEGGSLTQA